MPEPFKNFFGMKLAYAYADHLARIYPAFPADHFLGKIATEVEALELKGRAALFARALHEALPADYAKSLPILMALLDEKLEGEAVLAGSFWIMPIAQFVEDYGLDDFDLSMQALYEITQRFTSEFAVRPFLIRYPDQTLALLRGWLKDENEHVRRWISEGTRPRLPWGRRLDMFIRDPEPVLALLEALKDDPSEYVRKSVANNLNDISKDHPHRVLEILGDWYAGGTKERRWIVRHALRTLVKKGDPGALAILGYKASAAVSLVKLELEPQTIKMGSALKISLDLLSEGSDKQELVIDYLIHFVKAKGNNSPKVFKWTTRTVSGGETLHLEKSHAFKPITTRVYYAGRHQLEVQVNGNILGNAFFDLELF